MNNRLRDAADETIAFLHRAIANENAREELGESGGSLLTPVTKARLLREKGEDEIKQLTRWVELLEHGREDLAQQEIRRELETRELLASRKSHKPYRGLPGNRGLK